MSVFELSVVFLEYPCKSEQLGFYITVSDLEETLLCASVTSIACKCLLMPQGSEKFVVVPLCHSAGALKK